VLTLNSGLFRSRKSSSNNNALSTKKSRQLSNMGKSATNLQNVEGLIDGVNMREIDKKKFIIISAASNST